MPLATRMYGIKTMLELDQNRKLLFYKYPIKNENVFFFSNSYQLLAAALDLKNTYLTLMVHLFLQI